MSQSTIKTPEQRQVLLLLTLNIICFLFYNERCWIWTNKCHASWALEMVFSDRKIVFSNWEIYWSLGWENMLAYMFSSLFTQTRLRKDKFSRQNFKKIIEPWGINWSLWAKFDPLTTNILWLYNFSNLDSNRILVTARGKNSYDFSAMSIL